MKLNMMGVIGREAKISEDAPTHAGDVGRIVSVTTERAYVLFENGDEEWLLNRYIVGTRKVEEHQEGDEFPMTEMAAKKQCTHCGQSMAGNHWWKVGKGWQCKKSKSGASPKDDKTVKGADGPKLTPAQKEANEKAADARHKTFLSHLKKERGIKD